MDHELETLPTITGQQQGAKGRINKAIKRCWVQLGGGECIQSWKQS